MSRVHERLKDLPPSASLEAVMDLSVEASKISDARPKLVRSNPTARIAGLTLQKKILYTSCALCVLLILGLVLRKALGSQKSAAVAVSAGQTNLQVLSQNLSTNDVSQNLDFLLHSGRWSDAIPILEKALIQDPENANALILLALAKRKTSDLVLAKSLLEKAILLDPENSVGHNNLGLLLAAEASWDLAIKSYSKALAIRPEYPEAEMNSAAAFEATQRWGEAIAIYQRFLVHDKEHIDLHKKIEKRLRRLRSFQNYAASRPPEKGWAL